MNNGHTATEVNTSVKKHMSFLTYERLSFLIYCIFVINT
jgi:hypothetical protein